MEPFRRSAANLAPIPVDVPCKCSHNIIPRSNSSQWRTIYQTLRRRKIRCRSDDVLLSTFQFHFKPAPFDLAQYTWTLDFSSTQICPSLGEFERKALWFAILQAMIDPSHFAVGNMRTEIQASARLFFSSRLFHPLPIRLPQVAFFAGEVPNNRCRWCKGMMKCTFKSVLYFAFKCPAWSPV